MIAKKTLSQVTSVVNKGVVVSKNDISKKGKKKKALHHLA